MSTIEFSEGYFRALSDISSLLDNHTIEIKNCKLNNLNGLQLLLKAAAQDFMVLEEWGRDCKLVCGINAKGKATNVRLKPFTYEGDIK